MCLEALSNCSFGQLFTPWPFVSSLPFLSVGSPSSHHITILSLLFSLPPIPYLWPLISYFFFDPKWLYSRSWYNCLGHFIHGFYSSSWHLALPSLFSSHALLRKNFLEYSFYSFYPIYKFSWDSPISTKQSPTYIVLDLDSGPLIMSCLVITLFIFSILSANLPSCLTKLLWLQIHTIFSFLSLCLFSVLPQCLRTFFSLCPYNQNQSNPCFKDTAQSFPSSQWFQAIQSFPNLNSLHLYVLLLSALY